MLTVIFLSFVWRLSPHYRSDWTDTHSLWQIFQEERCFELMRVSYSQCCCFFNIKTGTAMSVICCAGRILKSGTSAKPKSYVSGYIKRRIGAKLPNIHSNHNKAYTSWLCLGWYRIKKHISQQCNNGDELISLVTGRCRPGLAQHFW